MKSVYSLAPTVRIYHLTLTVIIERSFNEVKSQLVGYWLCYLYIINPIKSYQRQTKKTQLKQLNYSQIILFGQLSARFRVRHVLGTQCSAGNGRSFEKKCKVSIIYVYIYIYVCVITNDIAVIFVHSSLTRVSSIVF